MNYTREEAERLALMACTCAHDVLCRHDLAKRVVELERAAELELERTVELGCVERLVTCGAWRHGAVEGLKHVETDMCHDPRPA